MRARTLLVIALLSLSLAAQPTAAAPTSAMTAPAAAKKKRAKKKAKLPTAKQCTTKAVRKLKGRKRAQRRAACAKRRRALARKKTSGSSKSGAAGKAGTTAVQLPKPPAITDGKGKPIGDGPFDYLKVDGLSKPVHKAVHTITTKLQTPDGVSLNVQITKPEGVGRFPVILDASPYNESPISGSDRTGSAMTEGGISGWFAPRGYATVFLDLRGTGLSGGCIDYLGPKDAQDIKHVIEWAAAQPWSNGRVGMTGVSYPGSTPILALAQRPEALKTVVPIAGWPGIYDSQFQAGVPFLAHWVSPIGGAYDHPRPARDHVTLPEGPQDVSCTGSGSAANGGEDLLSGRMGPWHTPRDSRAKAAAAPIPVFAVHGVSDLQVRSSSLEWFNRRGSRGDKLMLGNWGHQSPPREDQWRYALTAWFDKHLKQKDVETGPPVEVFFTHGTLAEAYAEKDRDELISGTRWPLDTTPVTFRPATDGTMGTAAPAPGTKSFAGTAAGFQYGVEPVAPENAPQDGAIFVTPPLERDYVVAGFPAMRLSASVSVPRVHLIATLYDQAPGQAPEERRRIGQFAINPELRDGLDKTSVVVPATRYDLKPPGFAMAHHLKPGHRLVLRISTSDPDKIPLFAEDPNVTVHLGAGATEVTLPVVPTSAVHRDDVPLKVG